MATVHTLRHVTALRALLGVAPETAAEDPAPGYDGPALWAGHDGTLRQNARGPELCDPLGDLESQTAALIDQVRTAHAPRTADIAIETPDARRRNYALTAMPHDGGVLVLARETTRQTSIVASAKASREMFRDIALSAGGFAFETDDKGLFSWTSPGKPLGFSPESMIGRPARDYVLPQSPDAFDPFATQDIVEDLPVWAVSPDQGPRALRMTVRPYFAADGQWRGTRGHARDETDDMRRLRQDRFAQSVAQAIRSAPDAATLLCAVAAAVQDACQCRAAWLHCREPGPLLTATAGAPSCEMTGEIANRTMADAVQVPALFSVGAWTGLSLALKGQGQVQGAVLIAQPAGGQDVSHDMQDMLRLISPHVAVALAYARLSAGAHQKAQVDPLTGLLDANGWARTLRLKLQSGTAGAVMAIECDRFKAFGDGLGRAAGEELLIEIAAQLTAIAGPGEVCARLGEATFALWMNDGGDELCAKRAAAVADAFRTASRRMSLALAATANIGIASAGEPGGDAQGVTARALQALNAARRPGRSRGSPLCSSN
jgi:diguanylate cyclase (GGDEF)-like protein